MGLDWKEEYQKKLVTPEEAVQVVKNGDRVGFTYGREPRALGLALAARLGELQDVNVEISVLSPLERTNDPLSIELGVHGIYIRSGFSSGCFLPQVATETGWSKEEFLSNCASHKAGLPPDAWRDPDTEVLTFTAEVFRE